MSSCDKSESRQTWHFWHNLALTPSNKIFTQRLEWRQTQKSAGSARFQSQISCRTNHQLCQKGAQLEAPDSKAIPRVLATASIAEEREIGRAHVCTPVTNEHLVCRLLLDK